LLLKKKKKKFKINANAITKMGQFINNL
jgi:hypothetical protein